MEEEILIEGLKEERDRLKDKLRKIESLLKQFTARTADDYPIVPGVTYYYENGAGKRNPIVFDRDAEFWEDVIWVKHNKNESGGYYYLNLYRDKNYGKNTNRNR